jgi:hypothetical protein
MLWPTCPRNAEHASVPDGRNSRVNGGVVVASYPVGMPIQIIQNGSQFWIGRIQADFITPRQQHPTRHCE